MILAPMSDIYGGQCQAPGVPPAFTYATVPAGATTIPGATYYIPQQSRKRGLVPDAGPMATMSMNSMITRGNEELLTTHTATNGTNLITSNVGGDSPNSNDAKKPKREENTTPSKVLHLRNLPSDCTETEVIHLGVPFGTIKNILMLAGKNQAFIEMQNLSEATAMVNYHNHSTATIRSRQVFVQYSKHTELKTDQAHPHKNAMAQAALQAAQSMMPMHPGVQPQLTHTPPVVTDTGGGPNRVLLVTVENMLYPVTLRDLHTVFSKCGTVLKIVTFTKNNQFQALIQYQTEDQSRKAIEELNSQNIYNACCTLRITYSKMQNLNVKFNNDKSRDYTRPDLSPGNGMGGMGDGHHHHMGAYGVPGIISPFTAQAASGFASNPAMLAAAGFPTAACTAMSRAALGGAFAASYPFNQVPGLHGLNHPAFHSAQAAQNALQGLSAQALKFPGVMPTMQGTPVLLASNLNQELVTPQALFTLFGVYGDVQRVKVLFEKRDNALIQMADGIQAQQALQHLNNNVKLYGKTLRVALSKHTMVQLPKEGQPDAGLTKDFSNSPLHRFKKPGSKNFQNIFGPSPTLHLSNIPPSVSEEDLRSAFSEYGTVEGFKFFPRDRKMALIQMGSTEEAVHGLIALHNKQLSESNHLRVSFSKSQV